MKGRFIWMSEDGGSAENVSEGVQALYDLVISSMNWGSGFWSWEDALPVAKIGRLAEFAKIDEVERYVRERKHDEETGRWRQENIPVKVTAKSLLTGLGGDGFTGLLGGKPLPHQHVFSSAGRCMWPCCTRKLGDSDD